ncbi:MAG: VOC family protein [Gemmatimonadota bacterium]|nr:VOC family protein [Gemmatimonadota bacterium]
MAKLFRVIVPVSGIDRAARFYEAVLGEPGRRVSPGRHYFDCEGVLLVCYDPKADGDDTEATPNAHPLYLAVDDLRDTYERAHEAGATTVDEDVAGVGHPGGISERPWGEVSFYASDPFGNPLCFVTRESVFTG